MGPYIVRRLLQAALVIVGILTMVFVLTRLSGDPTYLFVAPDATPQDVVKMRQILGFDRPLHVQYADFLAKAIVGDFGTSIRFKRQALELAVERLPATLELTFAGLALSVLLGVPAGLVAGTHRGTLVDNVSSVLTVVGQSMPVFWLGLMLIIVFAVELKLLPVSGRGTVAHLILPAFCVGAYFLARFARLTRSGMLETMNQDYIRTARAKGLQEWVVIFRHALKNISITLITVIGVSFAGLVSGAVVTETVFARPGMGSLLVESVGNRDYPLVQALVFVIAVFVVLTNLLTDLVYAYLDPRIKYG